MERATILLEDLREMFVYRFTFFRKLVSMMVAFMDAMMEEVENLQTENKSLRERLEKLENQETEFGRQLEAFFSKPPKNNAGTDFAKTPQSLMQNLYTRYHDTGSFDKPETQE